MPSRNLLNSQPHHKTLLPPLAGGLAAALSGVLILLFLCLRRRIAVKRTAPSASDTDSKKPPLRLSYNHLRRAADNFSPSLRLGQGGFGSVYRAQISNKDAIFSSADASNYAAAVKVMDAGSLQGEREFQNELLFSSKIDCKYIVSVMGFSSNPRKRRMLLVYELMENGSLQDCLFHKKSQQLKNWEKRFSIALSVAKGLEYLHHYCDPPIVHGDIKPSNILLDSDFNAKIGDFGLARFKAEDVINLEAKNDLCAKSGAEDNGSMVEETESIIATSVFELDRSPESVVIRVEPSPETALGIELSPENENTPVVSPRTVAEMASPCDVLDKTSLSEGNYDVLSAYSGGERSSSKKKKKSVAGKDWWWKQDNVNEGESSSSTVKDYVMEWIGNEIKKERPKSNWIAPSVGEKPERKKKDRKRRLDWWASLDDEKGPPKKDRRRPAREWWKEEYCEELERKNKKKNMKKQQKKAVGSVSDGEHSLHFDDARKERRNRGSKGSMDFWLDGLGGARKNSHDSMSGEIIPRSGGGGMSSTPSMRGTICYIAPEFGAGYDSSEKCDVYSYGVLLLVLISGRRPLQVTGSPASEFQRANLISWARNLARAGKLLELVDPAVEGLDEEKATVCITVALLCLQKSPLRRPTMREVVGMMSGELALGKLPIELSPSRFPIRSSRKKVVR